MNKLEKLCFISFLLLIFWLPIPLASNRTWAWSIAEVVIAIQTLLLILAYRGTLPWHRVNRYRWLLVPIGLFQVWVLLQAQSIDLQLLSAISPNAEGIYSSLGFSSGAISLDRYQTFVSFIKGVSYLLFAINTALLLTTVDRIKVTALVLIVSGTFQAFYGVMVVLMNFELSPALGLELGNVATGSFVYKNHYANYLMVCLLVGIGLIVAQLHSTESGSWNIRIKRWVSALMSSKMLIRLCLVIMVIALVMTRSRMGNTAFFAATVIGGLLALLFYKDKPRALTLLVVSILVIDTFIIGALFGLGEVKERLESTSMAVETRDQVVQWSMGIIRDYPITGTGMGSFYTVFPSYTQYNVGFYDHAHNEYVQFAAEAGVPATLVLGFSVLYALWMAFSAMRTRNTKTLKGVALGCLMAIIGMLMHISVDFNLQPTANALTFVLILVLAIACKQVRLK